MVDTPNAATPTPAPAAVATPAPQSIVETVTLTKAEAEQLKRDAARAVQNQSDADRYRSLKQKGYFGTPAPAHAAPTQEELTAKASVEDQKAERGLMALAADPDYRVVLDADPTLRQMLITNPLAVLPMYAKDAIDADDAISLVREALNKKKPAPTVPATPAPVAPVVPPTGAINTPSNPLEDDEYKAAMGLKNTEAAIAGMVAAQMKRQRGK